MRIGHGIKNSSGIILIVVMWVMVILTALAMSLSRSTDLDITLTKQAISKVQSKYYAWAGIVHAINQLRLDTDDEKSKETDSLYLCGIPSALGKSAEDIFKKRAISDGFFTVDYREPIQSSEGYIHKTVIGQTTKKNVTVHSGAHYESDQKKSYKRYYGLQDEERKININAINPQNVNALVGLITALGFDEDVAKYVSYAVVDWKDNDSQLIHESYGAEDDYYSRLVPAYKTKNRPFDSKEELMLVRSMTQELYAVLKDYITIFPKQDTLKVNFDTAPAIVLKALAKSVSGPFTNTSDGDVDSMVRKLVLYRVGADGVEATSDDKIIEPNDLAFNAKENVLFLVMSQFRARHSRYFSMHARGFEPNRWTQTYIDVVIARETLAIVSWYRQ